MRTPSLACAFFAAATLSPALVSGAPFPTPGSYSSDVFAVSKPGSSAPAKDTMMDHAHPRIGIKEIRDASPDHQPQTWLERKIGPRLYPGDGLERDSQSAGDNPLRHTSLHYIREYATDTDKVFENPSSVPELGAFVEKRTTDDGTLGGNAYTGNSGNVNGGDVVNHGNSGMPTLFNMNSNNAGAGGGSLSGCANGGHGNGRGSGGNAYSGSSGDAEGGSVWNSGGVMNIDSNNAGGAGTSQTGCATGGDVSDNGV